MRTAPSFADRPGDDVVAHLLRARDLLAREGVWVQGDYARDAAAAAIDSRDREAVHFCCSGALFATQASPTASVASRAVLSAAVGGDIEVWNDAPGRSPTEVVAAFDRAIVLARETARREA